MSFYLLNNMHVGNNFYLFNTFGAFLIPIRHMDVQNHVSTRMHIRIQIYLPNLFL